MSGEGPRWFVVPRRREGALRLLCFPHAGGAASAYHPLGELLNRVEIWAAQLPGRGSRITEAPITRMAALLPRVIEAVQPALDRPYALFGHSMGALIAFELAQELRRRGAPAPRKLIVSGRREPSAPGDVPPLHTLEEPELIATLCSRYGGIPQAVLQEPDLRRMFLRLLRADFTLLETHVSPEQPPLDCPVLAMGGMADPITPVDRLSEWSAYTTGPFEVQQFPGGHFYLQEHRPVFAAALERALA